MSSAAERKFRKSIQTRAFERVYYLYGDEELLKEHGMRELVDAAIEPGVRDFNLDIRSGGALDADALASFLATPPMMAERRVVVVRDVSALKKEARRVLDDFLRAPSPDVLLVLVEPSGGKVDGALSSLDGAVEFEPLSEDRVLKWIVHHARSALEVEIAPEAAELLASVVGGDLPALAAELDKLASYTSGAPIDEAAVSAVVGVRRGETMGDLLARVARRDAAGALAMLDHVLSQPKTSGVQIVMGLATQTLALIWAEDALRNGLARARLKDELFRLLKRAGSVYTGMPWSVAVSVWITGVERWDAESLDRALEALLTADMALKETSISTEAQILETLILEMCVERTGTGYRELSDGDREGEARRASTTR